jgi:hypothetical protein
MSPRIYPSDVVTREERKAIRHGNAYHMTPAALRRLKEAAADGVPMSELVRRFGMSQESVRKWLVRP